MITARLEKIPVLKAVVTKPYQGKGYAEGYEVGHAQGYTEGEQTAQAAAEAANAVILADCNAVLPTKGASTAETLEQVPARIGEIVVEKDFARYFTEAKFPNLNLFGQKEVVLNLDACNYASGMFRASVQNTTLEHLTVNCPTPLQTIGSMFNFNSARDGTLKRLTLNLNMATSNYNTTWLYYASALEVVDGTPLDFSGSTSGNIEYVGLNNLREIRFAPLCIKTNTWFGNSPDLSNESVQSIFDGLADLTGLTAKNLTFHRTVFDKLTDAQKAIATEKNWTVVRA